MSRISSNLRLPLLAGLVAILSLLAAHAADFSGSYAGTLTQTSGTKCGSPVSNRTATIEGDKISIVYNVQRNTVLKGTVASDGTFKAEADQTGGTVRANGKVAGDAITGTIQGGASCGYDLAMKKQ